MSSLPLQFLLMTVAGWMTRNQHAATEYLLAENAVLREQLRGRRIRYTDAQRRKLASAAKKLGRKGLSMLDTLVTPRTLLGWYRTLVANKYDGTARRSPAGRRKHADVVELVLRMATENQGWGYTRIRGALFPRIRCPLSPRAKSSGPGQPTHPACERQFRDDRTCSAAKAHRRIAQLLLSKRRMKA